MWAALSSTVGLPYSGQREPTGGLNDEGEEGEGTQKMSREQLQHLLQVGWVAWALKNGSGLVAMRPLRGVTV